MKFKDSKYDMYYVRFMRATEKIMKQYTVDQFKDYLMSFGEYEDSDRVVVDGQLIVTDYFVLKETANLRKEFMLTKDGRLFYVYNLNTLCELVDEEREVKKMNKAKKNILEHFKYNYTPVFDTWKYRYCIDPKNGNILRIERRLLGTTGTLDRNNYKLFATREEVDSLKGGERV